MNKKYDSTTARIAGNVLSAIGNPGTTDLDRSNVRWAVRLARMIIQEVEATEPEAPRV